MRQFHFFLDIHYSELQVLYQQPGQRLLVRTEEGKSLSIPFRYFRPWVTPAGLQGHFYVQLDDQQHINAIHKS